MRRAALTVIGFLLLAAVGMAAVRPAAWAQNRAEPTLFGAREALAAARGEAMRARERAALLDRQARASIVASDKAILTAAALAARVQQAEAALAASRANLTLIVQARRELDVRLARENAPVARLLAGLQSQARRPPLLQLLHPGSIADAVHLRAVLAAVEPQVRGRTSALRLELARARSLERDGARIAALHRTQKADLAARESELAALSAAERLKASRAMAAADREAERAYQSIVAAGDLATLLRRLENPAPTATGGRPTAWSQTDQGPYRLPVQGRLITAQSAAPRSLTVEPRPEALVVSPGSGRVAFAGPYRGFGRIVILEHAGGWTSVLTGLAITQVAVGQKVVAGSPLGQAPARQPRITVDLRRNGVPVDPRTRLR